MLPTAPPAVVYAYLIASLMMEGLSKLAASQIDPSMGFGALFTQLGVFAVVVVVFKFMLNRQDTRDARDDEKDAETLSLIREELMQERHAHEETRQKLYNALAEAARLAAVATQYSEEEKEDKLHG